jgi:23S rRNA pseudouridine2605 synthase
VPLQGWMDMKGHKGRGGRARAGRGRGRRGQGPAPCRQVVRECPSGSGPRSVLEQRTMAQERLQKVVAQAGIASRRAAEELITKGRVRVNGLVVTTLGTKVDPRADKVEVDGKRLVAESPVYLVLHKPRGVVSTVSDPEGRKTVRDLVEKLPERVFPVGRLDYHTSGVLLLTNDGDFCDGLIHPKRDVPKTYIVKVAGEMREEDRKRWEEGVVIDGQKTRPAEVFGLRHEQGKTWLEVTLFEGRNQQIRKMGEATGFPVMRLARAAFAGVTSAGLRPGDYRSLTHEELTQLREQFGVPKRVARARQAAPSIDPRPHKPRAKGASPRRAAEPRKATKADPGSGRRAAGRAAGKQANAGERSGRSMSDGRPPRARRSLTPVATTRTRKAGG